MSIMSISKELTIEPCYKCLLHCKMCSSVGIPEDIILTDQKLEEVLKLYGKNIAHIRLSGGEPLLLEEKILVGYIELINQYCTNLEVFEILTSGITGIHINVLNKVIWILNKIYAKEKKVGVSLYGDDIFHEEVTDSYGSYDITIHFITNLIKYKIKVYVQTPIISYGTMRVLNYCKFHNLSLKVIKCLKHGRAETMTPEVFSKRKQQLVVEEMKREYDKIIVSNSLKERKDCKCDRKNKITILPNGRVVGCVGMKQRGEIMKDERICEVI